MRRLRLFGERSVTLVAATFDTRGMALGAASALRMQMPQTEVEVVRPQDPELAHKLEPESQGIWRTALRSHFMLGPIGLGLGALVALLLIGSGWAAAASSPLFTLLFLAAMGLFAGLLVAGALTLRPDRARVADSLRKSTCEGYWAVVVHPTDPAQSERTVETLREAGGTVLRSF